MKFLIGTCFILASLILVEGQHRVAPGVPPQQYQQQYAPPPPPQQHQHMQPPQQQVPNQVPQMQQQVQYQQVPVQQQQIPQQQVPVQQQQVPVQPQQGGHPQGGHGHAHGHHQQLLNTANIMQEQERLHIQEHIDVPMDISKMTEQELQFHYFKMHDADRNDKLDGCELIKSLIHWHGEGMPSQDTDGPKVHTDQELQEVVDGLLSQLDKNNDGYIDYIEYKRASD